MKILLAKLALPPIGMLASGALFRAGNAGRISAIVGTMYPCGQDPRNSFPWNGMFDVYALATSLVFGLAAGRSVGQAVRPAEQNVPAGETACPI